MAATSFEHDMRATGGGGWARGCSNFGTGETLETPNLYTVVAATALLQRRCVTHTSSAAYGAPLSSGSGSGLIKLKLRHRLKLRLRLRLRAASSGSGSGSPAPAPATWT